jgi:hypothetical protein
MGVWGLGVRGWGLGFGFWVLGFGTFPALLNNNQELSTFKTYKS